MDFSWVSEVVLGVLVLQPVKEMRATKVDDTKVDDTKVDDTKVNDIIVEMSRMEQATVASLWGEHYF